MRCRISTCCLLLLSGAGLAAPPAGALDPSDARHLADLSLEELMNETITSVSKREERLADAPAAVTVVTNDEIRRSGATMIPDALRQVPGMEVGAANAHEWAVSVRGFNQVYSNKLLVLIDGRAVYTPLFGGVFWDVQQPMLEDVDRIEVIRGPGATIWGANAVNGVVNVVTRSARDTQGGLVYAATGNMLARAAGVRQGVRLGPHTFGRVFASVQEYDDLPLSTGGYGEDGWNGRHAGFRIDDENDDGRVFTWQADGSSAKGETSNNYSVNTLLRWTQPVGPTGTVELQGYYDRLHTEQEIRGRQTTDTVDLAAQHSWSIRERYDVVWGAGARLVQGTIVQTSPSVFVRHPHFERHLVSAFAQARMFLPDPRFAVTIGAKVEHNSYTGLEIQPTVRATYKPRSEYTLWAAVSRAVRTPGEVEAKDTLGIVLGGPLRGPDGGFYLPAVLGNPALQSEILTDAELGGRFQFSRQINLDVATFLNRYDRLISYGPIERFIPGLPYGIAEMAWQNTYRAQTVGADAAATFAPNDWFRLIVQASYIDLDLLGSPPPASTNVLVLPPRHQASVRVSIRATERTDIDCALRTVGSMRGTPAYTTADVRIAFRWGPAFEIAVVGRNLLDRKHLEQAPIALTASAEEPRQVYLKLTCRY
ncbi:MAG TPA: TonB-dependent receptor [Opitutaceae bacterium]|nr:TonB-dependent receptor [Opitutaceae bacterium]